MPTQPRQVVYTPVDMDDAQYAEIAQEPTEDELEFQKFRDEFKQANEYAKVSCYRQPTTSDGRPGQKQLTFLFEAGVEEFSFSQLAGRLRDEYGTGTYRIQLRDKEGQLKMNRAIAIEAPKGDVVANPTGDLIDRFSRAMAEQQNRTESMLREMMGPRTGQDAFQQMALMMGAMGEMMKGFGIQPQQQQAPKTLVEQLTEFKMIKELFAGDGDGGSGGEANLYSLLGETVKALGGPIAQALAAGAESGDLTPEGLATTGALPAPETKTDEQKEAEMHKVEMRKNIHILIQNAKTGIPADAFAQILVNNTPPDKEDALWDFISAETCVAQIIELEPAAAAYEEWFVALRAGVIDIMAEPEGDGKELLTEDGDGSKVPESDAVAGEDDSSSNDPDNGDTPTDS
jgi:hypothetical protein